MYDEDIDILKGAIIVAKNSAYLWAPTNIGGYGLYDQLVIEAIPHEVQFMKTWQKAFASDVSGAAGYFLGLGASMAIWAVTPGGNAAILGGAAIAAGYSSATALMW